MKCSKSHYISSSCTQNRTEWFFFSFVLKRSFFHIGSSATLLGNPPHTSSIFRVQGVRIETLFIESTHICCTRALSFKVFSCVAHAAFLHVYDSSRLLRCTFDSFCCIHSTRTLDHRWKARPSASRSGCFDTQSTHILYRYIDRSACCIDSCTLCRCGTSIRTDTNHSIPYRLSRCKPAQRVSFGSLRFQHSTFYQSSSVEK